jgi:DnaJ-domain-containing protein 1
VAVGPRKRRTGHASARPVNLSIPGGRELALRRARAAGGNVAPADPGLARRSLTEFEQEWSTESLFTWGRATVTDVDPLEEAYQLLGVDRQTPWSEITARYRRLARDHHPDRGGDAAFMTRITEAHALVRFAHGEH